MPIGKLLAFQYSGTEIAGCPVTLKAGVNAASFSDRRPGANGFSGVAVN
jgi:hypothetical protein